jgi:hypothetical protein
LGCSRFLQEAYVARQSRGWLAGDHHIHSHYSVAWNESDDTAIAHYRGSTPR